MRIMSSLRNPTTDQDNYLYLRVAQDELIAVLVAFKKRTKEVAPLQSIRWGTQRIAGFDWSRPRQRGEEPGPDVHPQVLGSKFIVEDGIAGGPDVVEDMARSPFASERNDNGNVELKSFPSLINQAYLNVLNMTHLHTPTGCGYPQALPSAGLVNQCPGEPLRIRSVKQC
jgi:hypothetical protein